MSLSVFILGAGRAGRALASALRENGVAVVGLHGRRSDMSHKPPITGGPFPESLASAEVVLVTVRDAQVDAAMQELHGAPLRTGAVILHASGAADPQALEKLRGRGHPAGTFHPLVPLTGDAAGAGVLRDAWIGVDGDPEARRISGLLASHLGASVLSIPEGEKASYHAAAVMASNFPCVLAYLARQLLAATGVPAREASAAVVSLMHASVENLRGRDPAAALTGPVVRGDAATVRSHLDALATADGGHTAAVYEALTLVAVEMVRQGGENSPALREIEAAISRK